MTTIFLEISKQFLIKKIQSIHDQSVVSDSSAVNKIGSFFGYGRNPELSEGKRKIANELMIKVKQMQAASSDEESLKVLKALLKEAKNAAKILSTNHKYSDEGNFGPAIAAAKKFTVETYAKLQEADLIDIPKTNEPLYFFRYQIASYLIQKLDDIKQAGLLEYYSTHPQLNKLGELAKGKEELIIQSLKECVTSIAALDKKNELYEGEVYKIVDKSIETIISKNQQLCKSHGVKWTLSISVSVFATLTAGLPTLRPDEGFVKFCMEQASADINTHCPRSSKALCMN